MRLQDTLRLIGLALLWSFSFLFIRASVDAFGAAGVVIMRVGIAAIVLHAVARITHQSLGWQTHWRHYLVLGLFQTALPFFCLHSPSKTSARRLAQSSMPPVHSLASSSPSQSVTNPHAGNVSSAVRSASPVSSHWLALIHPQMQLVISPPSSSGSALPSHTASPATIPVDMYATHQHSAWPPIVRPSPQS